MAATRSARETPWSPWNPTGSPRRLLEDIVPEFPEDSIGARLRDGDGVSQDFRDSASRGFDFARDVIDTLAPYTPFLDPASGYGGGSRTTGANDLRAQNPLGQGGPAGPQRPDAPLASDYVGPPPSGGGGGSAPQVATGGDPFAKIEEAQATAAAQMSALDDQYEARLSELRERYQFAETPEEKAQIQFLLGDLEQRRDAGKSAIKQVYDTAIADASERAGLMREDAQESGEQTSELYKQAAEDTAAMFSDLDEEQDSAFGVGGEEQSSNAQDWVAVMNAAAPREATAARQLGETAAEDVAYLGESMNEQRGAQQAQMERLAMQMHTAAKQQHDQRVQDRINQERMQFAQGASRLGQQFDQRRYALEDQITGLDAQAAGMSQDARMQNAQLQAQASRSGGSQMEAWRQRQQQAELHDADRAYQDDMREWRQAQREKAIDAIMADNPDMDRSEAAIQAQQAYPELWE